MRLLIEVRDEDVSPLRDLAIRDHRSVREQGGYLLHLKIHELQHELDQATEPAAEPVA